MQFPESWLREFCDPPLDSAALCELLTMAGMEVEEARPVAPPFTGVVVGQVLSTVAHPNADRLTVCSVDVGAEQPLSIVCGAANVRAGIKVPVAVVGAQLPPTGSSGGKPFDIHRSELRGVESHGMLCSARELGLDDDTAGLLILDATARLGENVRDALLLDDTLITLKLTPNLGHCLSVYGVAREVAALTGAPLAVPPRPLVAVGSDRVVPVHIEAPDLCGRFVGRVVTDLKPDAATPAWMVQRLMRCGQRPVSPLVDISNYVMFEFGRPSHVFDLDKIHGDLTVRWARAGESLTLLNGNTVALDPSVGVIADAKAVESLAGIMGGVATAVSDTTQNIYVEAAFWWPDAVAGRSRRFNFTTEAGHRFERGVDPATTVDHLERITQLIVEVCGGSTTRCGPVTDCVANISAPLSVRLRVDRASRVIGMPVTQAQCEAVMQRLGLPFESRAGVLSVTPPSWRFDLKIEEDLIEEVIRVLGYDSLPAAPPRGPLVAHVGSESERGPDALRQRMVTLGYRETINFSFVEERWEHELAGNDRPIRVLNPIASSLSAMRSSLLGSLMGVLTLNVARKATRARVFEVGRVFFRDDQTTDSPQSIAGVSQPLRLGGLAYGTVEPLQWGSKERALDFFDVKADVEALLAPRVARFVAGSHPALHPGRSARIELDGVAVGVIGELHPRWRQAHGLPLAPLLFELDVAALARLSLPAFEPLPRQQSAWRDLAVIAPDAVTHEQLMQSLRAVPGGLIRSARLFDIYKPATATADMGSGERSLALRIELLDVETTLTDERIDAVVTQVVDALGRDLGLRLRS